MGEQAYTIVDTETTGASFKTGRVIELGLIRVEHGEIVEKFQTFFQPDQPVPEIITKITGITDKDLVDAPRFEDVAEELIELFRGSVFVAHNVEFDYMFLKREFRRAGLEFNLPRLCTVRLSRSLYPEHKKHNLTAVIERFGFECRARHRAFDDAHVLWQFFNKVGLDFPATELQAHIARLTKTLTWPTEFVTE